MKASVFLLVVAALFAVSFADETQFTKENVAKYIDGLVDAGVLPRVKPEEVKDMSFKELLDAAIEGLGTIIKYLPSQAALAKESKILYEAKRAEMN